MRVCFFLNVPSTKFNFHCYSTDRINLRISERRWNETRMDLYAALCKTNILEVDEMALNIDRNDDTSLT